MARGSHMTRRYGGKKGSFSIDIERFAVAALESFELIFREVFIQCGTMIINLTPVDTGRMRGNYRFSVTRADTKVDEFEFDPEGEKKIAELIAMANTLDLGQKAIIANSLVYAIPLEYGHSQKAPRGMIRVTIENFEMIVKAAEARYNVRM